MKILVDAPSGMQELLELGEGGKYFDDSRVLWDERKDGPLPAITLGGMNRQGKGLVFDATKLAAHAAKVAEKNKPAMPSLYDRVAALEAEVFKQ